MANEKAAVSGYGATNPAEDFAETVVAYRYNGGALKKTHPA
jgi:Mlc titration factor MtfA (ptsG expression regulator)